MIKKLLAPLMFGCLALGLSSCSEDFDIAAPYRNITVVYGFLHKADTAHYIRIQKAFLDENTSALTMAKISDSSFYSGLVVKMEELALDGTVMSTNILDRVIVPKDTGIFFDSPNYAYKYVKELDATRQYRLSVFNPLTQATIIGQTGVIDTNRTAFIINDFSDTYVIKFQKRTPQSVFTLTVQPPTTFESGIIKYFEGIIRFNYREKNNSTGTLSSHSLDWTFARVSSAERNVKLQVAEASFYAFLRSNLKDASENTVRTIDSVDMFVWESSNDYSKYLDINGAQGGLTAGQIRPVYSNLSGKDAIGLYTTRALRSFTGIPVDAVTHDSLQSNIITQGLHFVRPSAF